MGARRSQGRRWTVAREAASPRYTGRRMSSAHVRTALRVAFLLAATASGATAQDDEPIGRYIIDLRGSSVSLGRNEELALVRRLRADQLPSRGIAVDLGGHFYFLRLGPVTFGIGASFLSTAAHQPVMEAMPEDPTPGRFPPFTPQDPTQDGEEMEPLIEGIPVTSRFTAISPQISFNFGHRNGWSYVGGGLGTSRLNVYPQQLTTPVQRGARTLNYGGGARWFLTPNVALSLDLRFFAISPLEQFGEQPGSPRQTLMAANIGVSVR